MPYSKKERSEIVELSFCPLTAMPDSVENIGQEKSMSNILPLEWPARSPDLNPCDFTYGEC